jgi:hypothetical protein
MSSADLQRASAASKHDEGSNHPVTQAQGFPEPGWSKKVSPHSVDVAGIKAENANIDNILSSVSGTTDAFLSETKENGFLTKNILDATHIFEHAGVSGAGLPDEMNTAGDMGVHNTSFVHSANMGQDINARDGGGVKS